MPRADKKQRHKAKRKAKQLEKRRRDAVSPLKRLAESTGALECWMSEDFEELGQIQMFVYRQAAGLSGVACFLVDRGVVGLKDAWTQLVDREEFNGMLDASRRRGISMRRVEIDDIRRWVAGGIRWAHENGMRLPKDWARPATLINGVGEWTSADVSAFTREFIGHPEDLRQRLIGEPFETYVRRTDIDFVFSDDAPFMDQETGAYVNTDDALTLDEADDDDLEALAANLPLEELARLQSRLMPAATALSHSTADWVAARGDHPSPELIAAWQSTMAATMLANASAPDSTEEDVANLTCELMEIARQVDTSVEFRRAVGQVKDHLQHDPLIASKAVRQIGLADGPDETDEQS